MFPSRLTPAFNHRFIRFSLFAASFSLAGMILQAQQMSTKLGTNLTAVVDYTREWPFIDSMKIGRTWISQQQGLGFGDGPPLTLTAQGWPAVLAPGQSAETIIYDNNVGSAADYPTGQYTLLYDGSGTLRFDNQSATIVSQSTGSMIINVPSASNGIYLEITATNSSNPIRNIRLLAPGLATAYTTNPFHPTFLNKIRPYGTLRFMEWMQTNGSTITTWAQRPHVTDYTYTRVGVPIEVMIQLANATGAAPWFNIPAMADDAYVFQFATLVKAQLNPSIKFYIEYSNETWNGAFSQSSYIQAQGIASGLSTDPTTAGAYYTAVRSVQIFNIFNIVFGGTSRFTRVIASQAANPYLQAETVGYRNAYLSADALAVAPYFSDCSDASIGGYGPLGAAATAATVDTYSVAQVLAADNEHIQNCVLAELQGSATVANTYGLKLVAYEGGQSLAGQGAAQSDTAMASLFAAANRDPGMGALYSTYLNNWKNSGGGLFMHFTDVTPYNAYGNFGSLEYQDQDPTTSPKYQALMNYAAANP